MLALRIDRQIEEQFRKTIGERRGIQRGNLKNALEEAIAMWTQMHQKVDNIRARRAYKEMVLKQFHEMTKDPVIRRQLLEELKQREEREKLDNNESK